ncbi:hypothetical protein ACH9L7_04000 [Haloferax sp. S1W]|uniref:hypothetical protein n=1 Tax=Haloferax sp. S1W TaxID=3377110 RepID=UPI0037CADEFC
MTRNDSDSGTIGRRICLGTATVGTAGAKRRDGAEIVGEHHFIRAAGDTEPSPIPDPQDPIVERRHGNPVDNGTKPTMLDGSHHVRWGEFRAVNGRVTMDSSGSGTDVSLKATGLLPGVPYTAWIIVFEEPGFDFSNRTIMPFGAPGTAAENVIGAGALGHLSGDSSIDDNNLDVRGGRGTLSVTQPAGDLTIFGSVPDDLSDVYEVHIVGDAHLDGQPHGAVPGPTGAHVEHFGAAFIGGDPL